MKEITSKTNKYVRYLASLINDKKNIVKNGQFIIEGRNLVNEAIDKGIVIDLLVTDKDMFKEHTHIDRTLVTNEVIDRLSTNKTNNGCIAVCKYNPVNVDLSTLNKIVVLENINNPGNLGSIMRTALSFDYEAIVLIGETVFPYNDKVIKSSQGAFLDLPVITLKDVEQLKNFELLRFTLSDSSSSMEDIELSTDKYGLVFGNEANGLTPTLLKQLPGVDVKIDISDNIDSLNLAIASAIAMYKYK